MALACCVGSKSSKQRHHRGGVSPPDPLLSPLDHPPMYMSGACVGNKKAAYVHPFFLLLFLPFFLLCQGRSLDPPLSVFCQLGGGGRLSSRAPLSPPPPSLPPFPGCLIRLLGLGILEDDARGHLHHDLLGDVFILLLPDGRPVRPDHARRLPRRQRPLRRPLLPFQAVAVAPARRLGRVPQERRGRRGQPLQGRLLVGEQRLGWRRGRM